MKLNQARVITLKEAREVIRRAVEKAEELKQKGSFVVVDDSGILVSASRMDGSGAIGMPLCRAKAHYAGANREPGAIFYDRVSSRFLGIYLAYQEAARDRIFPGQGAMLIRKDGMVIGAISTGGALGPFVKFEGVDPDKLIVDGEPTNAEDLIICYALGEPYQPQHGDDMKRWMDAYGFPPGDVGQGTGFAEAPPVRAQKILEQAVDFADAAIEEASRCFCRVSVAVTDRNGDLLQQDRMDGAAPMTPDIAEATAMTAINFKCPSRDVARLYRETPELNFLEGVVPFKILPIPGGVPIMEGERIIGAIGISGGSPDQNEQIAEAAIVLAGGALVP